MKSYFSLFAVVATLLFCLGQTRAASIITFQEGVSPSGAYAAPAVSIRADASGRNENGSFLNVGRTSPNDPKYWRAILDFDLTGLSASDTINSVSLSLTHNGGGNNKDANGVQQNDVAEYELRKRDYILVDEDQNDWDDPDGDGDDATGEPTPGGTFGTILSTTDVTFFSPDGTVSTFGDTVLFRTAVEDALAGDGVLRLFLTSVAAEASSGVRQMARFHSEDNDGGNSLNRPKLVIDFTPIPEPSSIALCTLLGIAGCGLRRRHGASV